ncbi:MAG: homocysteine S-methyltransferase family protein [Candidatus Neomarinimicrobiota bacterium]
MATLNDLLSGGGAILLDGALGTELAHRGVATTLPLWSAAALKTAPHVIRDIHRDYREAGAQILTANTFRTTPFTYRLTGQNKTTARDSARSATRQAVSLAREAAADLALVAGSLAPVGDCYDPAAYPGDTEARENYGQLAPWLAEDGADLLLLETQVTLQEARIALEAAAATGLPVLVSYLVDLRLRLWDGTPLPAAVQLAEHAGAHGVLVNCVTLPVAAAAVEALATMARLPFGVYANAGRSQPSTEGVIEELLPDDDFVAAAARWVTAGARFIGGCCGTTPATIESLARRLAALANHGQRL